MDTVHIIKNDFLRSVTGGPTGAVPSLDPRELRGGLQ
jgi:hypothetical protein